HYTGREIGRSPQRFQFSEKILLCNPAIKAGDRAGFVGGERRDDLSQIVGLNPHVAVRNRNNFVSRVADHQCQAVYFSIFTEERSSSDKANSSLRICGDQTLDKWDRGVELVACSKQYFVVRVVLLAKTGE